jgi:hypothetical protein
MNRWKHTKTLVIEHIGSRTEVPVEEQIVDGGFRLYYTLEDHKTGALASYTYMDGIWFHCDNPMVDPCVACSPGKEMDCMPIKFNMSQPKFWI